MSDGAAQMVERWLGRVYHEVVLNRTKAGLAPRLFKEAVEADSNVREAAKTRLAGLSDSLCDRDYISMQYRRFLQAALQ